MVGVEDGGEAEVGNFYFEVDGGEIDFLQKLVLLVASQLLKLWLVGEVKQYVGQLHIPMHYLLFLHGYYALHKLLHDYPGLFLSQGASLLQQSV